MADYISIQKSTSIAWRALRRNNLQTILTMVGMTIGVATVLTMIALGSGAQAAIQDQVRAAGMNVIVVTAGNYKAAQQWTSAGESEEPGDIVSEPAAYLVDKYKAHYRTMAWEPRSQVRLKLIFQAGSNPMQELARSGENAAGRGASDKLSIEDADAIADLKGVQFASPGLVDNVQVSYGDKTWFTHMHAEGKDIVSIRRAWVFPKGRFFNKAEVADAKDVIVLGSIATQQLFGSENPVGKDVTIRGKSFRVVGVMASGSWMVPSAPGDDQFDAIYMPVTTGQKFLNQKALKTITISTVSTGDLTRVTKSVSALLRQRHGLAATAAEDFTITSQSRKSLAKGGMRTDVARAITGNATNLDKVTLDQLGKTLDRSSRTMTALLASVASVSLIVGGIGIMNIMLLSVTERTREIGIRRSVGARSDDVMMQFLMEAVTLSLTGGILGILFGVIASTSITKMVAWSTSISPLAVAISFGVSAGVGILFGYYPAREASRVSPMTSLRYE